MTQSWPMSIFPGTLPGTRRKEALLAVPTWKTQPRGWPRPWTVGPTGSHQGQGEKQMTPPQAEGTVIPGESSPPQGSSWLEQGQPQA